MSKTYRSSGDGRTHSDGGRHYSSPRYRSGSRQKAHRIVVTVTRRDQPDLARLARELRRTALETDTDAEASP
ncbi:MAG TPA: hypothetical protein PKC31_00895 [Candidatus Nanoperiomorbaceae bacterium]|nr:hypothetical protein [Candidatus Nanoperiomorbaceae bacterium]